MRVLVLNGGTGTVKGALATVAAGRITLERQEAVAVTVDADPEHAFGAVLDRLGGGIAGVDAVGHRVVHGGTELIAPTVIDAAVEALIERLVPLAPLHNPMALAGIRVARARLPERPMVAVFDTAFHADRPPASRYYALPSELVRRLALYRYGFHGIAHASLVRGVAALEQRPPSDVTAVTLQLGQGCSACAIDGGRSVETSMGFTPLEGLVMATRAGDVDPGLVIHLQRNGMTLDEVETMLTRRSGLLGVGGAADVRDLLAAEGNGNADAALALALFVRHIVATVGAYFTLLGGRGVLVFGGGIGEHSAEIRRRVGAGLGAWNVHVDETRNAAGGPCPIAAAGTRPVYVVATDEASVIAEAVAQRVEG